jgi:hypothetical protein
MLLDVLKTIARTYFEDSDSWLNGRQGSVADYRRCRELAAFDRRTYQTSSGLLHRCAGIDLVLARREVANHVVALSVVQAGLELRTKVSKLRQTDIHLP